MRQHVPIAPVIRGVKPICVPFRTFACTLLTPSRSGACAVGRVVHSLVSPAGSFSTSVPHLRTVNTNAANHFGGHSGPYSPKAYHAIEGTRMRINEIEAKSMLVKSKLPASDYVVNPYIGCSFACAYCYASFMGRLVGQPIGAWGDFLSVKTNALEVFRRDLARLPVSKRNATILPRDGSLGHERRFKFGSLWSSVLKEKRVVRTCWNGRRNALWRRTTLDQIIR
jgi:hypothetical protein